MKSEELWRLIRAKAKAGEKVPDEVVEALAEIMRLETAIKMLRDHKRLKEM